MLHPFVGVVAIFDGTNEELRTSLNSSCKHLNPSPASTLNMDSEGILIGRLKTPIWAVEEGYAGKRRPSLGIKNKIK